MTTETNSTTGSLLRVLIANPARTFIVLFLLVLSSISFYTTYDGLIRFSYGSFEQTPQVFIVVLFLFVSVLQGMLLFSLFEMLRTRILLKFTWLIVYVVTMGVSVFFSYSFYYNLFRAESYAFDNFSVQLSRVKNSALDYQDAFKSVQVNTNKLADYSRDKAEEEREKGGTCGYASAPNSGPRSRYRDKEDRIFKALSSDITGLYTDVSNDIIKLEGLVDQFNLKKMSTDDIQNEMNRIVQRLNGYKSNGNILNLTSTLRSHMYEGRVTDGIDPSGSPITCPDDNIDIKGTGIIKQVEVLPEVNEVKLFNPNSEKAVLSRALTVFMQIPKAIVPNSWLTNIFGKKTVENAEATKISAIDYAPLFLGGLIDLFIFIVGLADGIENRRSKWGNKRFKGRYINVNDIPSFSQVGNGYLFLDDFRKHIYRNRAGNHLVIPASMDKLSAEQRGVLDLAEALESAQMLNKPKVMNVEFSRLHPSIQASLNDVYTDAELRLYTRYILPKKLWDELQQAYYAWHINNEIPD
ncbi:MAG TPA: hypothetical protein EYG68_10070 [Leucothrix mucor]|nr:hypothetical protein [Leucothrix mucor]